MIDYEGYKTEHSLTEDDRVLTEFEEKVLRLCHHDFEGRTQALAAFHLDVSQKKISKTLSHLREKAPQLFPILTKRQALIRGLIVECGFTHRQVAETQHISVDTVDSTVATLKEKGICFPHSRKTISYEEWMDKYAKRMF